MSHQSHPLRVAIVASSLQLAGAEKQTFYLARALHNAGVVVHFFYLGQGGHYETALRQTGVVMHQIYYQNRPFLMLARLMASWCCLRPHIVLAAQFGDLRYVVPAGRLCQALILGGVRSDGFYELNRYGRVGQWMSCLTHGLMANSYRARQNLVVQNINPAKIEVLPNVIDLPDFDARSRLPLKISLPANRIIMAAVGNLHHCKRFDRFIDALALARQSEPALTGVIAGADRGIRAELEVHANVLGLTSPDLIFLGEFNQVPALLARSAMLVLTSEYEGFPNVIIEAMSARLPVISMPAGDVGLIVQQGQTGYVVKEDDIRSMAAFMVQLAQSPATQRRLGEAGRKRVEEEYDCEPLAGRLLSVFYRFARRQRKHSLCRLLDHTAGLKNTQAISKPLVLKQDRQLNF